MTDDMLDTRKWFSPGPPELHQAIRELFQQYSGIAPDLMTTHVERIRDKAWSIFPYPCIGYYVFLEFFITQALPYDEVLRRLKDGQKLIDIGCCFGQDIRKLIFDGAPKDNVYGFELHPQFIDLGFELFRDQAKLGGRFTDGDFFDPDNALKELDGTFDVIHSSMFFHLFNWDSQVKAMSRAVRLLRPKPGSMVFGADVGTEEAGIFAHTSASEKAGMWRHNEESCRAIWAEVMRLTDTRLRVDVELDTPAQWHQYGKMWLSAEARRLRWAVYME